MGNPRVPCCAALLASSLLTSVALGQSPENHVEVRFHAAPDTVLLLDGEVSDDSSFRPSSFQAEEPSYLRACAGKCTVTAAPGTYTIRVVANDGHRIEDAMTHSLPPLAASEPMRLDLRGGTMVSAEHESYAGRRTAAVVVLWVAAGAGLVTGIYGATMDKPALIGVGAGAIVAGYAGYYLLRKEDEIQVRLAPLQAATAADAQSARQVAFDRSGGVVRGAALNVAF